MANKNKYTFKDSSEALDAMGAAMGEYQNNAYKSGYDSQIKTMSDSILGQKKFSYDPNSDPTYQYAKKSYTEGGRKAMKDTQAQAAALTGGYGNSYGQIAGQQVYGDYMSRLSDMIPELEQQKYQRYRDDQSERYQQLAMLQGLDERDYGRWQYGDQKLGAAVDYLGGVRDTLYGAERDKNGDQRYADETAYNRSIDERNFDYQKQRDAVGDSQWERQFENSKTQSDRDYYLSLMKANGNLDNNGIDMTAAAKKKYIAANYVENGEIYDMAQSLYASGASDDSIYDILYQLGITDPYTFISSGGTKAGAPGLPYRAKPGVTR